VVYAVAVKLVTYVLKMLVEYGQHISCLITLMQDNSMKDKGAEHMIGISHQTKLSILVIGEAEMLHHGWKQPTSVPFGQLIKALEFHRKDRNIEHIYFADHFRYAIGYITSKNDINTIFIDPFSLLGADLDQSIDFIFEVRKTYPEIVFVLYIDFQKLEEKQSEFYAGERKRLAHYHKLDQNITGEDFDSALVDILDRCLYWHESQGTLQSVQTPYEYDVALSFAGEDREYAQKLAQCLSRHNIKHFYDDSEQAMLWGQNLFEYLYEVYSKKARYCVIFISQAYAEKMWTNHERKAAQERAFKERGSEYILPIRIDNAEIPGMMDTIAYLSIKQGINKICRLLRQKLVS